MQVPAPDPAVAAVVLSAVEEAPVAVHTVRQFPGDRSDGPNCRRDPEGRASTRNGDVSSHHTLPWDLEKNDTGPQDVDTHHTD